MEKILITKLKSSSNENGYNVSLGGIGENSSYIGTEICLFDKHYNLIGTYNSIEQAKEKTGQCTSSIRKSAERLSFTNKRYLWIYKNQLIDNKIPDHIIKQIKCLRRPVYQFKYDKTNSKLIFIKEHESVSQAARNINSDKTNIRDSIVRNGTHKGFIWKYKDEIENVDDFCKNFSPKKIPRPTKTVYRISYTKNFVKYKSVNEACVNTPGSTESSISQCCLHYIPSAFGYIWAYEKDIKDINDYIESLDLSVLEKHLPVLQFDLNGNLIKEHPNAFEASKTNDNFSSSRILLCCRNKIKTSNGYTWEFKCNVDDLDKYKEEIKLKTAKKQKSIA